MFPKNPKNPIPNRVIQYRVQKILEQYPFLLLIIPILFIIYPLVGHGIVITGDFPYFDTSDYAVDRLWLWIEKGSIDGFEFVPRFPIIALDHFLSIIGINSDFTSKAMVLSGFIISSFSFYFSFTLLFKSRFIHSDTSVKFSAILGSLFYAYNVWSFNRIHHWYLWIGYSLLPLFLISIFLLYKSPRNWKLLLISVFLWTIASSTPHMVVFYGFILFGSYLVLIFNTVYNKRKLRVSVLVPLLLIVSCYVLVNMYWIYPYILGSQTQDLTPNYELTQQNLDLLSRDGNFLNSLRVMAYWLNSGIVPDDLALLYLSIASSFVIPIVAFLALLIKRLLKFSLIFSVCAIIGIILAMGTQSPIGYYKILLIIPVLSKLAWLFRDPDKWSFLISLAYAYLSAMVSFGIFSRVPKQTNNAIKQRLIAFCFAILLIGSIVGTTYPYYVARMNTLKPVSLPPEFDKLNAYLSTVDTDKVYFMPSSEETQWKKDGVVGSFYQTHSIKPSIESSEYNFQANNYYNYLVNSIMKNKLKNISNFIYPLGTKYIVFHNDTWSKKTDSPDKNNFNLLNKLYSLDLKNPLDIGFYKIFAAGNVGKNSVKPVNILSHNIGVYGGFDAMNSLNTIPSYSTLNSSILFLDDIGTGNSNIFSSFGDILSSQSSLYGDFIPFFTNNNNIIAPFDATMNHQPSEIWSKSTVKDLTNAEYHPYLKDLGIENWDFDYGKGLVITKAMGAKLSLPLVVQDKIGNDQSDNKNEYYLFLRYLKNEKGGPMRIYIDNQAVKVIDTFDKISNNFVWKTIGSAKLSAGRHTLTLENIAGFNAVNVLALLSPSTVTQIASRIDELLNHNMSINYLLEAESNFRINADMSAPVFQKLFEYNNSNTTGNVNSSTIDNDSHIKKFTGQLKVPSNANFMTIQFNETKIAADNFSTYNVDIWPASSQHNIFKSDFERIHPQAPLATMRKTDWMNYDKDLVSTSLETNRPLYGNNSLRVDMKQGDKSGWNILSTDFIPVDEESYYNANSTISATDVKQLHPRIIYYDSNKKVITVDTPPNKRDGTFQNTFSSSLLPPKGTKYIKYQILSLSANPHPSLYILDNFELNEIMPSVQVLNNNITNYHINSEPLDLMSLSEKLDNTTPNTVTKKVMLTKVTGMTDNGSGSDTHSSDTEAFAVKSNLVYNYAITVNEDNLSSINGVATFENSTAKVQNSASFSNGRAILLSPDSEASTKLEIIKSGKYKIALRTDSCESCKLHVGMELINRQCGACKNNIQHSDISVNGNGSKPNWTVSNDTYNLSRGIYEIKFHSDSAFNLDSLFVYEDNNQSLFSRVTDNTNQVPALAKTLRLAPELDGFKKVNPTKYVLYIKNATRPYFVSLSEAYDPLWSAHTDSGDKNNFRTNSLPLYGVVNGFVINKTGSYSLILEYQPQDWFIQGATISTFFAILILSIILFYYKKNILGKYSLK